ncbi:MAG TPA: NRDE family protein [Stellaceae bacterium]|nr:NRDE family protein [Stellaceae bacterium]
MCTLVILRRPEHHWPVIIGANRDEMIGRPALAPARHWPDRPEVVAGLDQLAYGSWLGINDWGVAAAVLNRHGSLGPAPGQRSRGELVLGALDHPDAVAAAEALTHLDPAAYRTFNLIIADNRDAFWLRHADGANIDAWPIRDGLSLIDSGELNRPNNRRVTLATPRFRDALPPDPDRDDWTEWEALLSNSESPTGEPPENALRFTMPHGYGTVSSALIALPAANAGERKPRFRYAQWQPTALPWADVNEAPQSTRR